MYRSCSGSSPVLHRFFTESSSGFQRVKSGKHRGGNVESGGSFLGE